MEKKTYVIKNYDYDSFQYILWCMFGIDPLVSIVSPMVE